MAKAYGNTPRRVVVETMREGYTYGGYYHKADVIELNRDLIESARLTCVSDGLSTSSLVNGANAELVDTIFHENYHAYQRDVIDGKISHPDKREAVIWATNLKRDQNGNLVHYLSDGIEYRIQSCERTAFREGESGTRRVFGMLEKEYGPDYGYADYQRNLANNSYEKQLAYAQTCSGNPYFQEDLDEEMLKQYAQEHGLPYVRQSPGKEEADHAAAMNALQDYMNQHNYSAMDYPEYSQDPEWQQLHQNVYGKIDGLNHSALEQAQSPEAHTAAVNALSEYMNEHNYGNMDYPEYSKDPEWQKLNNDLLIADGKAPIHYNSDIANNQDSTMNESPDKPVEEAKENTQNTTFKQAGQSRLPVVDASEGQNDAIAAPNQAPSEETSEEIENSVEPAFDKQNGTDINESQGNTEAPALHDQLGENELETQDNHHIETQQLDNTEDANLDNTLDENMGEAQSNIDRSVLDEQASEELDVSQKNDENFSPDERFDEELDACQENDEEFALDESSNEELDTSQENDVESTLDESFNEELDVSQENDEEFSLDERSAEELNVSQEDDAEFSLDEPSNEELDVSQENNVEFSLDELPSVEIGEGQNNMEDQSLDVQSEEAREEDVERTNTVESSRTAQEQENIEAPGNLMDATLDEHTEETAAEVQDNIMDQSLDEQRDEDSFESQDNTMDASMDEQHDAGESESQSNAMDNSLDEQYAESEAQDNTMESSLEEDHDMDASQDHATDTQQTEQYADDETASQDQSQRAEDTVTMDDTLDDAPAYDSTESTTGPDHENEEEQDYSMSM